MEIKTTYVEDEFLKTATPHKSDGRITIESCDSTLGDVARWMAAWCEEDMPNINKGNYRTYNKTSESTAFYRWEDNIIVAGGDLSYYVAGKGDTHRCKDAMGKEYPLNTKWTEMIADYIDEHWDDEVHVISYYSGCQGVLINTVFDKNKKCALFSFASLEHYGRYRAR